VSLTIAVADLLITGGLSLFFDLVYIALCVAMALLVRPADFFTIGVLPPLLLLGLFWLVGLLVPGAIADTDDSTFMAALTGLADHATALMLGYALCLGCLAMRHHVLTLRAQGGKRSQPSKRSGSPAPRRTTVGAPSE
jgi:Domain of unknown function (DUF6542)